MQVTRLEIFGFKSFMERLVLNLDQGVTAIIGPNGCGKSNIVDAIRWVLGETRARNLRGTVLEDIIFNGTASLRPLGLAEVTMTLRSTEEDFFADLVSPQREADLLEAQLLDDAVDPLETVNDEDQQVQADAEGNAEVEARGDSEGEIVEEDSDDGRPRLTVISGRLESDQDSNDAEVADGEEKAAPVSQPAVSRAALLHKFSWLKAVSEIQVTRRVYRSGESEFFINRVPCRLKDIKEIFSAVGLGTRMYTIVAQGEVTRIVTAKPEERRLILEEAAGVQGFRTKIVATQRRLEETAVNISRLDDIIKEVSRQVNSLKRQAARARNRVALREELEQLAVALWRDKYLSLNERERSAAEQLSAAHEREETVAARLQREQAQEESLRANLLGTDVRGDDLRRRVDAIKEDLRRRQQRRAEKNTRVAQLKAFIASREAELKRQGERRVELERRRDARQLEVTEAAGEVARLRSELSELGQVGREALTAAQELLKVRQRELRELNQERQSSRDKLIAARSREAALVAQAEEMAPEFWQAEEAVNEQGGREPLFADGLEVPADLVEIVQAVLGDQASFVVSTRPFDLAERFSGAGSKQAFGVFRAGGPLHDQPQGSSEFQALLNLLVVDPSCQGAAQRLLGNVYLCPSAAAGIEFFKKHPEATLMLVTPRGELLTADSYRYVNQEGGLLQLKQRIAEQGRVRHTLEEQHEKCDDRFKQCQAAIAEIEREVEQLREDYIQRQEVVRRLGEQLGRAEGRHSSAEREIGQLGRDLNGLERQVQQAERGIAEQQEALGRVEEEITALKTDDEQQLQSELGELESEYATLDQQRQGQRRQLGEQSQIVVQVRRELDAQRSESSRLQLERQRVAVEQEGLVSRIEDEHGEQSAERILAEIGDDARLVPEQQREFSTRLGQLRARIIREGEVDPTSIDRLAEEQERLTHLTEQKQDLEQAAATLKRTIAHLSETSQDRFMATFQEVRQNFSRLVPRLFGGGRGSLELTDPDHPLESGLEIIARPPGKKLKSIDLLSGGEKALCATALIVSLFQKRPSPLCVLDEVDAPLDDANLDRFLGLIKEMTGGTQFIIITHNKSSMAMADQLVGVTMQEPGASKVLSVSLQEAVSQVA